MSGSSVGVIIGCGVLDGSGVVVSLGVSVEAIVVFEVQAEITIIKPKMKINLNPFMMTPSIQIFKSLYMWNSSLEPLFCYF
jgi:hypothetical protein